MPGQLTVGCKIPAGLLLQVFAMEDHQEPVMGGGWKTVQRAVRVAAVRLHGSARAIGRDVEHEIRFGVGFTHGVDADLFEKWMKDNKDSLVVKNNLVFASAKREETVARARDSVALKSGLEPLDPNNLPLEFRGAIKTAEGVR